ncbi:MAG: rhomboid family intramembrane serine protease [Bacteroidetes bacterium]|nr:rhomboid family intramembrane serine protease [Bacteroidota bacterium]
MQKIKFSLFISASLSLVILFFFILQHGFECINMHDFAIVPNRWKQFYGIFTTVFVHANFQHFLFNITPFFVLVCMLVYFYMNISIWVFLFIWFFGGVGVFFFGEPGYHIGASGIVFGLIAFLISSGFIRQNRALLTVSLIVTAFYGSSLIGVFPNAQGISWEGHLFGSISGVISALLWRNIGPSKDIHLFFINKKSQEDDEYIKFSS